MHSEEETKSIVRKFDMVHFANFGFSTDSIFAYKQFPCEFITDTELLFRIDIYIRAKTYPFTLTFTNITTYVDIIRNLNWIINKNIMV